MQRRELLRSALALPLGVGAGLCLGGCSSAPKRYEGNDPPQPMPRWSGPPPKLALVLGSGGPRGFAHVGVLRALESRGITPDLIIGTSMGALVGVLYASGMPVRQIQKHLWQASPSDWFSDITWHRFAWLTGAALQRDVNQALSGRSIEQLPTRFIAVATMLPTGERVEFGRGDAGAAVRASSSVPGLFVPFQIGENTYGDGDLVAPVPVATAKRLGAHKIIAVDVSADLRDTPDWSRTRIDWITQGIQRKTLVDREMVLADWPIQVRMQYYASATKDYKNYAADMGEQATLKALENFR